VIHLDSDRIAAILDGSLPAAQARWLADHLAGECPVCERALQDGPNLDLLFRLLDAADAPPVAPAVSERQRIWAGVEVSLGARTRWRLPAAIGSLLLAASVLLLIRVAPVSEPGIKGAEEAAPEVHLRVVAGRTGDGSMDLERRIADGDRLTADHLLLFELETDRSSARYLFAVDGTGRVDQLVPSPGKDALVEPPGRRRVADLEGWTALGLDDLQGPVRLVGAASTQPLPADEVIGGWLEQRPPVGVGFDVETVEIAP